MSSGSSRRYSTKPVDILLVEDNPGDVRLVREAFAMTETSSETVLHVVNSGDDAVKFLRQVAEYATVPFPDLVLMDLNLPGRDGCDVLETIRDDPQLRQLPVIMVTGSGAREDVVRCYNARANAYLTKPTDPDEFASVVEAVKRFWLEQARLPDHRSDGPP